MSDDRTLAIGDWALFVRLGHVVRVIPDPRAAIMPDEEDAVYIRGRDPTTGKFRQGGASRSDLAPHTPSEEEMIHWLEEALST